MSNKYLHNVSLKEHAKWLMEELDGYQGNDAFDAESAKRLMNTLKDFSASLDAGIANTREEYEQQVASVAVDTLKESDHVLTVRSGRYAGKLEVEFYASYDDELSSEDINTILDEDNPDSVFAGKIEDVYDDEYNRTVETLKDEVKDAVLMKLGGIDDINDIVTNAIDENVIFQYPFEHYLKQEVRVPIMLDTGDAGHDYTLNCLMNPDAEHPTPWMHEHSSALWLAKQQGYTEAQLVEALQAENVDDIKDEFLRGLSVWASENIAEMSVEKLAAHCHMSTKYFQTHFRRRCGITPGKFLNDLRMNYVSRLLECTAMKLSSIAEAAGFYDASHLCRVFRQQTGMTPARYRKKYGKWKEQK